MKVDQLARLLDHLVQGLDGLAAAPLTKDLGNFAHAMEPFGQATVAEFVTFLGSFGLEFHQTGKITPQGKIAINKPAKTPKQDDGELVASAVRTIKELFAEIDLGSVDDQRVDQVLKPISKLTVPQLDQVLAGLDIAGKPRPKAKMVKTIRQVIHHQMESHTRSTVASSPEAPMETGGM